MRNEEKRYLCGHTTGFGSSFGHGQTKRFFILFLFKLNTCLLVYFLESFKQVLGRNLVTGKAGENYTLY